MAGGELGRLGRRFAPKRTKPIKKGEKGVGFFLFFGIHLCPGQGAEPQGTPCAATTPSHAEDANDKAGPDKESSGNVVYFRGAGSRQLSFQNSPSSNSSSSPFVGQMCNPRGAGELQLHAKLLIHENYRFLTFGSFGHFRQVFP